MFDGDVILSWRPQNIASIGLMFVGYILLFVIIAQIWRKFESSRQ